MWKFSVAILKPYEARYEVISPKWCKICYCISLKHKFSLVRSLIIHILWVAISVGIVVSILLNKKQRPVQIAGIIQIRLHVETSYTIQLKENYVQIAWVKLHNVKNIKLTNKRTSCLFIYLLFSYVNTTKKRKGKKMKKSLGNV